MFGGGCEKTAAIEQTGQIIGQRQMTKLTVQQRLFHGAPYGRVPSNPQGFPGGIRRLEQLQNLVDFAQDIAEFRVGRLLDARRRG